ncbi:MAG: glycosyltransferase [Chloroflexi bacterium]|nr:glycosyltransferase [Chloroflexota bacterium]
MATVAQTIPIVLFAYNRPDMLARTLECLRDNHAPMIYAFSDGARVPEHVSSVRAVRKTLNAIDWCKVILRERTENLGLGRSIRAGVAEVLAQHDTVIVFEDDLICVPGTYAYLCAALDHYRNDARVLSVTGWTHPRITPSDVTDQPYFDGRAECLVWGTWQRAWQGMELDALDMIRQSQAKGIDVYRYGADLPAMAAVEHQRNIWAVRWLYLHILRGDLCLRPPHSLVEHIGSDDRASNADTWAGSGWLNPPLRDCPPIPSRWPLPMENAQCSVLWQKAYGAQPTLLRRLSRRLRWNAGTLLRQIGVRS